MIEVVSPYTAFPYMHLMEELLGRLVLSFGQESLAGLKDRKREKEERNRKREDRKIKNKWTLEGALS